MGREDSEGLTTFFRKKRHSTKMEQLVLMLCESQKAQQETRAALLQLQMQRTTSRFGSFSVSRQGTAVKPL